MCWCLQEGQKEAAFKGPCVDVYRPAIVGLRHVKGGVGLDEGGDEEARLSHVGPESNSGLWSVRQHLVWNMG